MFDFEPARRRLRWPSLVLGILFIFISISAIMRPGRAILAIVWLIAVGILLKGIFSLIGYFVVRYMVPGDGWYTLLSAFIDIVLAIVLFLNLSSSFVFLGYLMAFWFIFDSFNAMMLHSLARFSLTNSFLALLGLITGVIMLFNPLIGSTVVVYLIGFYLFLFGLILIVRAL